MVMHGMDLFLLGLDTMAKNLWNSFAIHFFFPVLSYAVFEGRFYF